MGRNDVTWPPLSAHVLTISSLPQPTAAAQGTRGPKSAAQGSRATKATTAAAKIAAVKAVPVSAEDKSKADEARQQKEAERARLAAVEAEVVRKAAEEAEALRLQKEEEARKAFEAAEARKPEQQKFCERVNAALDNVKKVEAAEALKQLKAISAEIPHVHYHGFLLDAVLPKLMQVIDLHKADPVRKEAHKVARELMSALNVHGVASVVPRLLDTLVHGQWRSKIVVLDLIEQLVELHPETICRSLSDIITALREFLFDTKREVAEGCNATLEKVVVVIENPDVVGIVPNLLKAMLDASRAPETIQQLASVTFVQVVDASTLAIIVPLLFRGLQVSTTSVRRQCAVIINNMAKLVEDALDATPFLPTLLPQLERASEEISDPEARAVATRACENLHKIREKAEAAARRYPSEAQLKDIVHQAVGDDLAERFQPLLAYIIQLCADMFRSHEDSEEDWNTVVAPQLANMFDSKDKVASVVKALQDASTGYKHASNETEEVIDAEDILCDTKFTLAYGSKVLLHNTTLRLLRGRRYGLLGGNDSGKSSLLRAIADARIEGFPSCRCVIVEADIQGEMSHLSCVEYILADPAIQSCGSTPEQISAILQKVNFTSQMTVSPVSTLSGGWRMKLALARAMLQSAEVLLMDEPSNHLDVRNVQWLKDYLNQLKGVTCVIVSHDSGLLNDCCSHILHINELKLHEHRGNLSSFVELHPEARSFFELKSAKFTFKFPQPGFIPGVKSKGKALMRMTNVTFAYPGNTVPTITNASVQISLSSRVACLGPNGAGKSTLIKLLTGELEPQEGTTWKHPSARVAYVAQHAFHYIENHLTKTANEYIRWRYEYGEDKESLNKVTLVVSDEEAKALRQPRVFSLAQPDGSVKKESRVIDRLTGIRRPGKKEGFEYEVAFERLPIDKNLFMTGKQLEEYGFAKHIKIVDTKVEAREGMYQRALTQENVEQHLEDLGLDREFGTHNRISALSGGQKVKVVLAACMWNQPHIVILDEPTNYLDRDSLAALAGAIKEYEGGVVMITHNNEFCKELCPETWLMENGVFSVSGDPSWMDNAMKEKTTFVQLEEMVDATGNVVKVKQEKAKLSRKDKKKQQKKKQAARERGEDVSDDSEDED